MKILQEIISDSKIIDILQDHGIYKLYPPQGEALPYALDGKNIVLSVPTAGGKSLVAYLTIMHRLSSHRNGKALYVVPLRALAREKYEELKLFEKLGFRIGISTGDLHESNPHLSRYDVIVCTSEKADSLLRHGVNWLSRIVVLVVDEIHLIHDPTRGPTLEVIISRFKALNPRTQIVALSATIKNASELADWLDGKLISSDWRPVPLKEGVFYRDHIMFDDGSVRKIENTQRNAVEKLVEESILDGGQVLVFVNTRRSTVSLAKTLSNIVENSLSKRETQGLKQIVESLKQEQSEITSMYNLGSGTVLDPAIEYTDSDTITLGKGLNSGDILTVTIEELSDKWYYLYVTNDINYKNFAFFSIRKPDAFGNHPSINARYVGTVYNDGSSNLRRFRKTESHITYLENTTQLTVLNGNVTTTYEGIDTKKWLPPTAQTLLLHEYANGTGDKTIKALGTENVEFKADRGLFTHRIHNDACQSFGIQSNSAGDMRLYAFGYIEDIKNPIVEVY